MKKNKFIKWLFICASTVIVLVILLLKQVESPSYPTQSYYKKTITALDSAFNQLDQTSNELVLAGWDKQNITPNKPVRIVGYGIQDDFERVNDSIYVRTTVFSQGKKRFALISYDLLFVHPNVVDRVANELLSKHIHLDGIYYAATHSHNSFGGWGFNRLFDEVILDGEEDHVIQLIVNQTIESINNSINNLDSTLISSGSFNFEKFIRNRIPGEEALDPWMHVIQLVHPTQKDTALIATFSAHATCLFSIMDKNVLSGDYPGMMSKAYENVNKQFTFCAGGVASFSPRNTKSALKETETYAQQMLKPLIDSISTITPKKTTQLSFFKTPLYLPEPIFRIGDNYQLRPWLFKSTIGFVQPHLQFLRIGHVRFLGFPGEISGELYQEELEKAKEKNVSLVITSLNGNYTGYFMPQSYYQTKTCHELREMNWFGPQSGQYFKDLIHHIIDHIN